jgi:signal transduction histidine kinase
MMNLGMLRDVLVENDGEPLQLLDDSVALVENCAHDIRTLAYLLHPPRLDASGLVGGLSEYASGLSSRTDIRIRVEAGADFGRLFGELEAVLFRVAQESLVNVVRHSGSDSATIRLRRNATKVVLEIEDYGHGMPSGAADMSGVNGVGIAAMRERLHHFGATLEIKSDSGGTTVRAVVPLSGGGH